MGSMRSKLKCVVEWLSENVLCLTVFAEVKISFRERGWGKVSGGWLWYPLHLFTEITQRRMDLCCQWNRKQDLRKQGVL